MDPGGYACSFNDSLPTIKDNIRALIGDVNSEPVAYISDATITAIATQHNNDLYTSAAECADMCAARCLQLRDTIRQGTRFEIKNFDPVKAYQSFLELGNVLRNKSTIGSMPSYGYLGGTMTSTRTATG